MKGSGKLEQEQAAATIAFARFDPRMSNNAYALDSAQAQSLRTEQ